MFGAGSGSPKIRLPGSLSAKLLLAILPLVILAVSGIVWLEYSSARRVILSSINGTMRLLAQRTAGNIDDLFDQRYRDLFTLSETPLIVDYYRNVDFDLRDEAETYRRELERYLGNFAERGRSYAGILYLDRGGRAVCRVGTLESFSPRDFAQARRAPRDGWWASQVEDVPGVGPVVYYAKPVRNDVGELKGMLVLGYDLTRLTELLRGIKIGKSGRAYVRAEKGRLLTGREKTEASGLLTAASPLRRRPWMVFVEAPLDDFLEPLRTVRDAAIAASLIGLICLIAVLLWMVRSITRPIAALVTAARRIGEGDLGHRIGSAEKDEIGALSNAFDEMADKLEENRRVNGQLQSQLIQAEKLSAVGQLISSVAHELNNPLAAISGYVQIALMESCPPQMRADLSHVYQNVLRSRKVVDNLLFFVRQSRHERKRVDLNAAVEAALELLEYRLVKTEDVGVVKELSPVAPEVLGDFQQIVQVLINLIGNACDAMQGVVRYPEGKRLRLRTVGGGDRAFIIVEDNGMGVPADAQEKLFQPFFTTKEPGRGTGLGLSICRQIVVDHGGEITFESRPGEGTAFRIELPVASAEELEAAEAPIAPAALAAMPGKRVLVADDEADIAELMARLLREDGDEVEIAHNGAEALKLLETRTYDLVISDMEMEHAKGADLFVALSGRKDRPATKILFVTGDILNPKVLEFLTKTSSEYLVKPFDVGELRQTIRRLLSETNRVGIA